MDLSWVSRLDRATGRAHVMAEGSFVDLGGKKTGSEEGALTGKQSEDLG